MTVMNDHAIGRLEGCAYTAVRRIRLLVLELGIDLPTVEAMNDARVESVFGYRKRQTTLEAPGRVFDEDGPPRCFGICLGACVDGNGCPFLGCMANASSFETHPPHP
jgi:hypothetical protein